MMHRLVRPILFIPITACLALLVAGCQQYGSTTSVKGGAEIASSTAAVEACMPSGAHGAHAQFDCRTCHSCPGGGLSFDPEGAAVASNQPLPTFDTTAKTCSNVACHGVAAGTYTYSKWDWGCECMVQVSLPYGGTAAEPYWYAEPGAGGCTSCHGNPPTNYNYTWHGWHSGGGNSCTLCHPHVVAEQVGTTSQYVGVAISDPTLHANGTIDVSPAWKQTCFNCH